MLKEKKKTTQILCVDIRVSFPYDYDIQFSYKNVPLVEQ